MGMDFETFKKGSWKAGLFECDFKMCIAQYCCTACAIAQVHEKVAGDKFPKIVACLVAWCGFGGFQIIWYGTIAKGEAEPCICAILKTWCCGICYLHQQYKECGATEDIVKMITKIAGPAQMEMK